MADNRLPGLAGQGGMQQTSGFNPMANMGMGPMGQPMFGGVGQQQQQQQFAPGMQFYQPQGMNPAMMGAVPGMAPAMFPIQTLRQPAGPPPPYTQQLASSYQNKTRRLSGGSSRGVAGPPKPKTDKERYFEEQQKRLRQIHKPGAQVTDANTLVDNLFGKTEKSGGSRGPGHKDGPGPVRKVGPGTGSHPSAGPHFPAQAHPSSAPDDDDDGFGDFLGGPASMPAPAPAADNTGVASIQAPSSLSPCSQALTGGGDTQSDSSVLAGGGETQPVVAATSAQKQAAEKKDLLSMMMECSDLNAPQKARGFHKPSLIEVQKSGVHHGAKNSEVHHVSDHARRWDNTQELEGLFILESQHTVASSPPPPPPPHPVHPTHHPTAAHHLPHPEMMPAPPGGAHQQAAGALGLPGVGEGGDGARGLPPWSEDSGHNLPMVYRQVLEAVSEGETIVTERLYPILMMSGLPREQLGRLWNLANTGTPGHLTRPELWVLLAFVALVQNNYDVSSPAILKRCPQAPVPFLGQPAAGTAIQAHNAPGELTAVSAGQDPHATDPSRFAHNAQTCSSGTTQPFPTDFQPPPTYGTSTAPVTMPTAVLATSNADDDFADFQTATAASTVKEPSFPPAPAAVPAPITTRTEDSYGEFIGGHSASDQSLSIVPKEAAEKLEKLYSNGGMMPEDQYNSNVRNFFCSSDSSTAESGSARKVSRHTTPNSMDDEDFTDGHDSMSAVSTSEQSENEDIRAFENYVEEFNRKKEAKITENPLHSGLSRSAASRGSHKPGGGGCADERGVSGGLKKPAPSSSAMPKTPPAVNMPIPKLPGTVPAPPAIPALPRGPGSVSAATIPALPPAASTNLTHFVSKSTAAAAAVNNNNGDDDDFDDFKSATGSVATRDPSFVGGVSVGGVVVGGDAGGVGGGGGGSNVEPTAHSEKASSAVARDVALIGDEDKYGALRSLTTGVPSLFELTKEEGAETQGKEAGQEEEEEKEEEEWADFSAALDATTASAPTATKTTTTATGSLSQFHRTSGVAELPVSGTQHCPALSGGLTEGSSDTGDWADFAGGPPTAHHSFQPFSAAPVAGETAGEGPGDDWADFASAKPDSGPAFGRPPHWQAPDERPPDLNHPAPFSSEGVSSTLGGISTEGSRGLFSAATAGGGGGGGVAAAAADFGTSTEEVFSGVDQSAVMTVKKRNLGASEIMNVFKVRDDPATLSSYELPKPALADHHRAHPHPHRSRRSRSGSKEHQRSPDVDDLDFGSGPPPLDSIGDDDDDQQEFSRGYDLDDIVNPPVPVTVYSPFGFNSQRHGPAAGYAKSAFTVVTKTSRAGGGLTPTAAESRSHSMSPESGETDSLSNRVSSLREDSQSVSSLDLPASKISSSVSDARRDSSDNGGGTDSQSVSSMEFGASEGGSRAAPEGGVSESKSLDSLDLRATTADGDNEAALGDSIGSNPGPQLPPGVLGPAPMLADRYNLDGQVEGSERYAFEWERCLASGCRHINNANQLFNTISSSTVCNEVLRSPQGSDYILGLIEIYRVVCRIMTALPTTAVSSASIEHSLKQIDLAWNNLTAFLVGASLLPDEAALTFGQAVLKPDSPEAQQRACGVCLLDVACQGPPSASVEATPRLTYGGRHYHAPCANFWVNCVDSMLPALKLPQLL